MLSSISPLGERARNQRWWITVAAYATGSTLGGVALGTALGTAGRPLAARLDRAALLVVAAVAIVGVLADRGAFGLHVPGPRRQVDEDWLARYRGWVYGAGFGIQLGVGFATIVSTSLTWVAFTCAALSGSPATGALIGGTFGLARALPILATARVQTWAELRVVLARITGSLATIQRVTTFAHIGAIVAAIAILSTSGLGLAS